jgi:hypothetical protein
VPITRTATPTSLPFTTTGAKSLAHTCAANTSILLLIIQVDANTTITGTPTWNTSENFSLIRNTGTGTSAGDVRQLVYGLVNPTAGSFNIAFTIGSAITVEGIAFAVSYLGTVSSSVAAAAIYLDEQINNAAATTVAMNAAVGGVAGRTAVAAATFFGGDGDPAAETASGGQFAELFDSATGTSTTTDRSYWVGDAINWTPAAVTVDWTGTASDECVGTVIELVPAEPAITSIDTDNDTVDTRTGVVIAGSLFGASETGSAKVEFSNSATYGAGTIVEVDVTAWSASSVTVTLRRESDSAALSTLFTLPLSPAYLWVTDSAGARNSAGFQFTLRPPGPTAVADLNTTATLDVDTTYLVRARLRNTGGDGGTAFRWVYSRNAGAWTPITTSSSVVKAVAAQGFNDGDDVPQVLGGSGTYLTNNDAASEDGTPTLPVAFPTGGAVEPVLSFQIVGADVADEDAIQLRLQVFEDPQWVDLDTYTNTPSITVNKATGDVSVTPTTGTLTVTGFAPTVAAASTVAPAPASLSASGLAPTVAAGAVCGPIPAALAAQGQAPTVAASSTAAPAPGALAATGLAPTAAASAAAEPSTAALNVTGFAPDATTTGAFSAEPQAGTLALAGLAPSVEAHVAVEPAPGALAATGLAPTTSAEAIAAPAIGTAALAGLEPIVSAGVSATADAGVLVTATFAPDVFRSTAATPDSGTLTLLGHAPEVAFEGFFSAFPDVGTLALTGQAPETATSQAIVAELGAIALTGLEPTLALSLGTVEIGAVEWLAPYELAQQDFAATPATAALALTGLAPEVLTAAGVLALPGVGSLVLQGAVPSLAASSQVEPGVGQAVLVTASFAPTITAAASITPDAGELATVGHAPTLAVGESTVAEPPVGSLVTASFAPTITAAASITPDAGELATVGQAPEFSAGQGFTAEPQAGALTATGQAPTFITGIFCVPDPAVLTATGQAPALQTEQSITPDTGAVTVTGHAPSLITGTGAILTTGTGALVVVGEPPEFAKHFAVAANSGSLAFLGWPPALGGDQVVSPSPGSLAMTGHPPFVIWLPTPARRRFRVGARDSVGEVGDGGRLVPVGGSDRQAAVSGRRRVVRVGRRSSG